MKTEKIIELLRKTGAEEYDILSATASFKGAEGRMKGIIKNKFLGRYIHNKKIAKSLSWGDNRLPEDSEYKQYDIEPMLNITANGDNSVWIETPQGGRPIEEVMLNPDPNSDDYKAAVASCYWCKGEHPRSEKARAAWYRRNAGAYLVYQRGEYIDPAQPVRKFIYENKKIKATFRNSGVVWQVEIEKKILGKIGIRTRVGYEIDNVIDSDGVQQWYPIPGYALRAPVTKSSLPFWRK